MKKEVSKITGIVLPVILMASLTGFVFLLLSSSSFKKLIPAEEVPETTTTTLEFSDNEAGLLGPNEVKFTEANFQAEVLDAQAVVLVEFYLSTCPYCRQVAANTTAASNELVGKAKVGKIEARENPDLSETFSLTTVPTFIIFKNGLEQERISGVKSKEELVSTVEKYL